MRLQLWSYNYAPEPTGIGPVSRTWAEAMTELGHEVEVIAAFPHYPEPVWEVGYLPRRELINGVPVLRLPLWPGRATPMARIRQELTFLVSQTAAIPWLGRADVLVAVSPSFPALAPAIVAAKIRRVPLVVWLQDILPDGAVASNLMEGAGLAVRLARRFEQFAYASAERVVVISEAFRQNLIEKGVPNGKIDLIYNPATREPRTGCASARAEAAETSERLRILYMGNIGHSQNLASFVHHLERVPGKEVELTIVGTGVASQAVRAEIRSERVRLLGVVSDSQLEAELQAADVGLVSQGPGSVEFNLPSKLMNYMSYGLPALAVVEGDSEVARLVRASGAGWVVEPRELSIGLAGALDELTSSQDRDARGRAAQVFARTEFDPGVFASRFDSVIARAGRLGR